ncbi:MAG: ATP-dependent RecD-like DNA helicase [Lachnospiraceae bacterium]|nr:ATP-dependent RecD-like DNA helicase [Lachnospiraceae bacterium]
MEVEGCVERIIWKSEETGFTVLSLAADEDKICCVGTMPDVSVGEYISVSGELTYNKKYGEQIKAASYKKVMPTSTAALEAYLGSGMIKGIGEALAKRIVEFFKEDTLRIIEEEPERLSEVKGISRAGAVRIAEQFEEKKEMRNAMMYLQELGISNALAVKIYQFYGNRLYNVIQTNPYQLAEDISGVGFKTADEIALKAGFSENDEFRIKAALYYTLSQAVGNGNTYLPKDELFSETGRIADFPEDEMERMLEKLTLDRNVIQKNKDVCRVYPASFYYMELDIARMLTDLNVSYDVSKEKIERILYGIEKNSDLELDDLQRKSVFEAVLNGVFILTGGPGTGKTTTINTIIDVFEKLGLEVLLAAPTGRAAKRMSEATGREARTIHRLLEYSPGPKEIESGNEDALKKDRVRAGGGFQRNDENPLEADVIIIDEMSMVDVPVMRGLLNAISQGTRVMFVGDVNQLPSVGPGNVLRDIIDSKCFNTVKLTKIFRQAEKSDIIVNAHKINDGKMLKLENRAGSDFFFLERKDASVIVEGIIYLVQKKISDFVGVSPFEVQVLCPMKSGELGIDNLNEKLQAALNPPSPGKNEREMSGGRVFRVGDKVMQIKNNYQLEWETKGQYGISIENGTGVFNGDCGIIREISTFTEEVMVEFDEGRLVTYEFSQLDELTLAYAITIHKSQGSEYPAVVIPLFTGPRPLFNRNVLYTAVTRAKKCVTIIGSSQMVNMMIANEMEQKRYTGLRDSICEMSEED